MPNSAALILKSASLYLSIVSSFFIAACVESSEGKLFTLLRPGETGIHFSNDLKEDTVFNIIEYLYFYNGGGVAVGDINNDGLVDVYFSSNQNSNKLYLNKGNFNIEIITERSNYKGIGTRKTGSTIPYVN